MLLLHSCGSLRRGSFRDTAARSTHANAGNHSRGSIAKLEPEEIRMNIHFTRLFTLVLGAIPCLILGAPPNSRAQVGVMITVGPPPLPIYEQPLCPGDGYIWTPGYWAYSDDFDDYYWVPGTWILAPEVGFFWTPGFWSWGGDRFVFYDGYWGPQVGFYGGVNYGFGYFGNGYEGGRWDNGHFFYNRSVNNINANEIHNVYSAVVNNATESRVSFNGGNGGLTVRPTAQQQAAARERHVPPVAAQTQQMQAARGDEQLRASVNRGKPPIAATARAGDFKGSIVAAEEAGGAYIPPTNCGVSRDPKQPTGDESHLDNRSQDGGRENASPTNSFGHVRDLPPAEKLPAPNTGNPGLDRKYKQEQEKQFAQQQQERQSLAQQQAKEDANVANQKANDTQKQQIEQRHQQQTQDLQERHQQQQQEMQHRMQPPTRAPERSTPPK